MTDRPPISLAQATVFLEEKGWLPAGGGERMQAFQPPPNLGMAADYRLYLPKSDESTGSQEVLSRIARTLAEIYGLPHDSTSAVIAERDSILAIQLKSEDYRHGSVPFLRFEGVVEKLRKALLHTAAFVITDSPTADVIPEEAQNYLARCRFLQTAVGSYIARVQLPDRDPLSEATLFDEAVLCREVNRTLVDALSFITTRVFRQDQSIYSDDIFEQYANTINIDVFRDIGELLERSGATEVTFRLSSTQGDADIDTGRLSPQRFEMLDAYVAFAQERLAADQVIDVVGRVVELRSRRPDRRRNYVGIAAELDGREVFIALTLRKQDYPYAVRAHSRNTKVRLRAAVRRMKTQLRVIKLETFQELEESAES